jgi:ATP-dependent helicase/nuclease subunit A
MSDVTADALQRREALDPTRSFIVQAPAGSGKTELLVQRLLKLIGGVDHPGEVLAITFTNKAAAEMRLRVLNAIAEAATAPQPSQSPDRERWQLAQAVLVRDSARDWQLLSRPELLNIATFDAFSRRITTLAPMNETSHALATLATDASALYREAAKKTLLDDLSVDAKILLAAADNQVDQVISLIATLLEKRAQWLPHLAVIDAQVIAYLRGQIEAAIVDALRPLAAVWTQARHAIAVRLAGFASANLESDEAIDAIAALARSKDPLNVDQYDLAPASIPMWRALASLLLNAQGEWRIQISKTQGFPLPKEAASPEQKQQRTVMKAEMAALIASCQDAPGSERFLEALANVHQLPDAAALLSHDTMLAATLAVLKEAAARLMLLERERCVTDFSGVALAAQMALSTHIDDVRARLDAQIKHILVDEFQDTNPAQFSMIESLVAEWSEGDNRTLFIVGDPMQSIYGFRDADVGIFLDAWQSGFRSVAMTKITLSANYRSRPAVIEWVNVSLENVFAQRSHLAQRSIPFARAEAIRSSAQHSGVQCIAHADAIAEAQYIANDIEAVFQENVSAKVAVIVRSKSHANELLRELGARKIALAAQEFASWTDRPIIRDLTSLTYVISQPSDRLSWFAWLRSPMVGLRLTELSEIANRSADVMLALEEPFADETDERISVAKRALRTAMVASDYASLAERVHRAWLECGGALLLESEDEQREVDAFFELLDEIAIDGLLPPRHEFEARIEREQMNFSTRGNNRPVDVLTIHKAKGLEWDVVYVPAMDRRSGRETRELLNWQFVRDSSGVNLITAARENRKKKTDASVFDFVKLRLNAEMNEELKRLLYVAATRARERLVLTGCATPAGRSPVSKTLASFLTWPAVAAHDAVQEKTQIKLRRAMSASLWQLPIDVIRNRTKIHSQRPRVSDLSANGEGQPQHTAESDTSDTNAIALGVVGHKLLQAIGQGLRPSPNGVALERALIDAGATAERARADAARLLAMLSAVKSSAVIAQLFSASNSQSASELPIIVSGSKPGDQRAAAHLLCVDLTYIDADGERWIVDYKFTQPLSEATDSRNLDNWLKDQRAQHSPQLARYCAAFSKLEPQRKVRGALYFPLIDVLLPV